MRREVGLRGPEKLKAHGRLCSALLALGRMRLEDRGVEGSRKGWVILELGRFGIQSGIPGSSMDWAPTVSPAL